MKKRGARSGIRAVLLATCAALSVCFFQTGKGWANDIHLCQVVPGETVAQAVNGKIKDIRAAEGKCVYTVIMPEGSGCAAFAIYQHPAGEYEGLRSVLEGESTRLDDLGDDAVLTFDQEAERYWLLVTKGNAVTLQISGDSAEHVRQVAVAALPRFSAR
ncbi:MAG: hypothetical protein C4563_11065 [Desulfobulbus sp.]|nr:MAG: hypothetical protein C4563_11065 [Desulfobulbus sp.]